jgi:hypothetical protein
MPSNGLCNSLPDYLLDSEAWKMVKPDSQDRLNLDIEQAPIIYWGKDEWKDGCSKLTSRRQNILLLAAALNGELT